MICETESVSSSAGGRGGPQNDRRPRRGLDSFVTAFQSRTIQTMPHDVPTDCPFCHWADDPDQQVVFRQDSALFLQNPRQQGALFGSGVIIPVRHAETVFDLTLDEVRATFELLAEVKQWM